MEVPVADAVEQLTDLVRRAEEGDDIVLTCDGRPAVRLVPILVDSLGRTIAERVAAAEKLLEEFSKLPPPKGPSAAHSADFLYGWDGLPA